MAAAEAAPAEPAPNAAPAPAIVLGVCTTEAEARFWEAVAEAAAAEVVSGVRGPVTVAQARTWPAILSGMQEG